MYGPRKHGTLTPSSQLPDEAIPLSTTQYPSGGAILQEPPNTSDPMGDKSPVVRRIAQDGLYYSPLNNDEDVNHNVYTVQNEVEGNLLCVCCVLVIVLKTRSQESPSTHFQYLLTFRMV